MGLVVFRADANTSIGMGHIMRCLSIADVFRNNDYRVCFIIADNTARIIIESRGYDTYVLHTNFRIMEKELDYWPNVLPDYIIIDSYYVTEEYFYRIKAKGGKLIYIDDMLAFPYPVDILINYGVNSCESDYRSLYKGMEESLPVCFLGPKYVPLRNMFQGVKKKKQPEKVHDILVSTGGSDELHLTLEMVNTLKDINDSRYIYHFLLGDMNKDKERIRSLSEEKKQFVLHENVSDMKSLIESCDLAISAAGSTLYEICACGVPFITYSLADNQIPGAEAFARLGLGVYIGDLRNQHTINRNEIMSGTLKENAADLIFRAIEELCKNYDLRLKISTEMQRMIDGCGAERLVEKIIE